MNRKERRDVQAVAVLDRRSMSMYILDEVEVRGVGRRSGMSGV